MKQTIEFKERTDADEIATTLASPWDTSVKRRYEDLILKPTYAERRYKFPLGATWLRIVPAIRGSDKGPILGVHALNHTGEGGGRHTHPKTLTPGAKSVFDHAYAWLSEHDKAALFSKLNKTGYRLLCDPLCLFWMVTEVAGKPVARLFVGSGYNGSRGGVAGLGHQIWQLTQEVDEDGHAMPDPADPLQGVQICVEKRQAPGARYPSYTVKRGRVPMPMADVIDGMDPEEIAALAPLEDVLHVPTDEEEWQLLERVIKPELVEKIRESMK